MKLARKGHKLLLNTITVLLFLLMYECSFAQGLYNNGANIVVTDGSAIYVDGSAINTGNYTSASSGLIKNSGTLGTCTMRLTGNWINNASTAGFSNAGSTVTFLGSAAQRIGGTGTTTAFYNVNFQGGTVKTFTTGEKGATISNFAIVSSDGSTVVANGKMTLTSTATTNGNLFGPTAGGYISGDVIVQSYYTGGNGSRRYKFASSPTNETVTNLLTGNIKTFAQIKTKILVTSASGTGFDAGASTNTIQTYTETLSPEIYSYVGIPSLTTTLSPGVGFIVFYRGDRNNPLSISNTSPENVTLAYQGTVNQGPITVSSLKYTPYSSYVYPSTSFIRSDGLNLVGNPYPCTINFAQIPVSDRLTINNTVYVGNVLSSGFSGIVNGVSYNGGSSIIQPGQSFFVQAFVDNSSITFRESSKYSGGLQPMRLLSAPGSGKNNTVSSVSELPKIIRINLQDALKIDETLITFKEGNKRTYDIKEDASYMGGSSVSLSTLADNGGQLLYNALPPIKEIDTIKLNVNASATKSVKLNFTDFAAAGYYQVYLKDNYLKKVVDVKLNPTYAFDINRTDAQTFGSERFVLLFKKPIPIELTSFTAKDNNGAELKWNTRHEEFNDYFEVERSIDGINFSKLETVDGVNRAAGSSNYTYLDKDPVNGTNYYRLKKVDLEGNVTYTDAISLSYTFNNLANSREGYISVYPNPAVELINIDIPNRGLKNIRIGIIDLQGKRIRTISIGKNQKIQENISDLVPGIYIVEVSDASTNELIGRTKFIKIQ